MFVGHYQTFSLHFAYYFLRTYIYFCFYSVIEYVLDVQKTFSAEAARGTKKFEDKTRHGMLPASDKTHDIKEFDELRIHIEYQNKRRR